MFDHPKFASLHNNSIWSDNSVFLLNTMKSCQSRKCWIFHMTLNTRFLSGCSTSTVQDPKAKGDCVGKKFSPFVTLSIPTRTTKINSIVFYIVVSSLVLIHRAFERCSWKIFSQIKYCLKKELKWIILLILFKLNTVINMNRRERLTMTHTETWASRHWVGINDVVIYECSLIDQENCLLKKKMNDM